MFMFEVNPSALMLFLGIVLSLLFDYLTPLKNWFDKFSADEKRKIMTGSSPRVWGTSQLRSQCNAS